MNPQSSLNAPTPASVAFGTAPGATAIQTGEAKLAAQKAGDGTRSDCYHWRFRRGGLLPWIEAHKRPAILHGYKHIWENHLKPICESAWLKQTRTHHVQGWLNQTGANSLGRTR